LGRRYLVTRRKCELLSQTLCTNCYILLHNFMIINLLGLAQEGFQRWACSVPEDPASKCHPISGCCDSEQSNDDCDRISSQGFLSHNSMEHDFLESLLKFNSNVTKCCFLDLISPCRAGRSLWFLEKKGSFETINSCEICTWYC